jgi:hypothetical protein
MTEESGLGTWQRLEIFPFSASLRSTVKSHQPAIENISAASVANRPEREAYHSPASSVEINLWMHISTSQYVFMEWYIIKHSDIFTYVIVLKASRITNP